MHIDVRNLMSDFVNYKSVKIVPSLKLQHDCMNSIFDIITNGINYRTSLRPKFSVRH